jgi:glycosyltransferase involved in cell wall biosynthesis
MVQDMTAEQRAGFQRRAMDRIRERYSWDAVTGQYEKLLTGIARRK